MSRRYALDWLGPVVVTFVLALLMVAVVWLYDPTGPLPEALDSYWLVIHVVSAITATGAFTLGGMTSVAYLLKRRRGPDAPQTGLWARVPSLEKLDLISYRIHAFGFPIWTFAVLITGPIWAHQAWSSYWNWDPKEVWAFITWVVYAAYLHARTTAGWRGRNAAILALVGTADPLVQLHRNQLLLELEPALLRRLGADRPGRPLAGRGAGFPGHPGKPDDVGRCNAPHRQGSADIPSVLVVRRRVAVGGVPLLLRLLGEVLVDGGRVQALLVGDGLDP